MESRRSKLSRSRIALLALGAVLLAVAAVLVVSSLESGDAAAPRWFAADSVWNAPLAADAPLAPKSRAYVAELQRQLRAVGPWINSDRFSTPVYEVGADQPAVTVTIRGDHGESIDPSLQQAMDAVPLPSDARPAAGSDGHLVVWQPSSDRMWEFWQLRREGSKWVAAYGGAMRDVSGNPGYFSAAAWPGAHDYWGATASSLPLLGGLMTIEELQAHQIDHALALAIPDPSPRFVWPAQRSDGGNDSPGAIPEGTRFRLPAGLDVAALGLSPTVEAIALAAQRYGMILRDVSGVVSLYGQDPRGEGNPYNQIFEGEYPDELLSHFPWQRLEAVAPLPSAGEGS